ncbi:MAG: tryptophan--tRNA ligase [Planctomycetes bacterium]|nr:tryptophan--tRNA ligase [Planctomycetota bacterium]
MKTVLSGIQPSGRPHLGNYFGAIRRHVALSAGTDTCLFFIADYHALTTSRDAAALRDATRDVALTYLALGLDVQRAALFRQSDVPEVLEIAWLLGCSTGMGLLERAHSYKDKVAKGIVPSVGLFTYPVLMAADIVAYDSDLVPVGKDQIQHVEMAQDMAASFNAVYGPVFRRPEALVPEEEHLAKVPGLDGEKMSKSYGNDLWIFESGKKLRAAVNRIVTDSAPPEEPKDPAKLLLFRFLELFLEPAELEDWRARVRRGGPGAPGYGHLKVRIAEAIEARFEPARRRREELLSNPAEVEAVLADGARRARERAQAVLERARRACGLR